MYSAPALPSGESTIVLLVWRSRITIYTGALQEDHCFHVPGLLFCALQAKSRTHCQSEALIIGKCTVLATMLSAGRRSP